MRSLVWILAASVALYGAAIASPPPSKESAAHEAKHSGVPPGLAKKGGLPPGLAKRFGPSVPARAYIAIDPRYDDRAWFLINNRWVLKQGFDPDLRLEVRSLRMLPAIPEPPPVPLPSPKVGFHVVLFR